ncbi:hypothetical protein LOK49_LG06G03317 [Camellia lanceoleosa]|uniref:Uncharacterized protein n=1 Tax=Camellia lanceoleosa TaxID=1840588 RepID=A0ACC0HGT8_9ERIC|nr:hypothetical protein LOK49_LG06G03317 [Camellia lanceoleosa]
MKSRDGSIVFIHVLVLIKSFKMGLELLQRKKLLLIAIRQPKFMVGSWSKILARRGMIAIRALFWLNICAIISVLSPLLTLVLMCAWRLCSSVEVLCML